MGFPAFRGFESFYRNSGSSVRRLFDCKHANHVKVYNLCVEDEHKPCAGYLELFSGYSAIHFPMRDHNSTSQKMLLQFCLDAVLFLGQDEKNVIAVHCKAGKGRTGLAIACYLMFV